MQQKIKNIRDDIDRSFFFIKLLNRKKIYVYIILLHVYIIIITIIFFLTRLNYAIGDIKAQKTHKFTHMYMCRKHHVISYKRYCTVYGWTYNVITKVNTE